MVRVFFGGSDQVMARPGFGEVMGGGFSHGTVLWELYFGDLLVLLMRGLH